MIIRIINKCLFRVGSFIVLKAVYGYCVFGFPGDEIFNYYYYQKGVIITTLISSSLCVFNFSVAIAMWLFLAFASKKSVGLL